MKIWVMQVVHEGQLSCSTHLTEKGSALAAIGDVLDFLGVEDKEDAERVMDVRFCGHPDEKPPSDSLTWDLKEMREMKSADLWEVLRAWSECTWDNEYSYQVDVACSMLEA